MSERERERGRLKLPTERAVQSSQYLAIVSDVAPLVVEGVEDKVSLVLSDAVAVDGVAGRHYLPGQPA